jgi:CRISPR-associated protein Cas1
MKRTIFIFSAGQLQRKENTLYFESEGGRRKYIPVENTGEIFIFGEVSINKKLLDFLSQKEIILHFYNYYGYYTGSFYPREHLNSGYMILKQAEGYLNQVKRLNLAKKFVEGAILNMLKVLGYYQNRNKDLDLEIKNIGNLSCKIDESKTIEELMAIEGNCKDYYYRGFDKIIENEDFRFLSRTRRPPQNRLNALISFGNSLIYTVILSEIYKTHLDPRIGFLHTTNFRRFSLNLDIAEIFKPIIVDRIIFTLLNKNILTKKDFLEEVSGIYLKERGQRIFVEKFDERLRTTLFSKGMARNISYRSLIRRELYKLEKDLIGDKEYRPFVARW